MIHITLASNVKTSDIYIDSPCKIEDLLSLTEYKYPIYLAKLDNAYRSLSHIVTHDCNIELLDITNNAAWLSYQDSLCFLYIKAVHDVLGKTALVTINNSLNKGLFTIINPKPDNNQLKRIIERMQELCLKDIPIKKVYMSKSEATNLCISQKLQETKQLLDSIPSISDIEIYSLDDETGIFYNLLVPSTKYLEYFELVPYKNGYILRYPHPTNPLAIPKYKDEPLLYDAFKQANNWSKLMNVNYICDLNNCICNGEYKDLILLQEALHEKNIADIASTIQSSKSRIVLICGPSSSGKTTFANRLKIQMQTIGLNALYLGCDDYFKDLKDRTYLPSGEPDLESINAVDTKLLFDQIEKLLNYQEVDIPIFDFTLSKKVFGKRLTRLQKNQVIVLEGIHCLNPLIVNHLAKYNLYKIYISPLTPLAIDHHNRIPTTDARMLRRLVRDSKFRNRSAKQALKEWVNVRQGEDENIFPFNDQADCFFNSNCLYELPVLKKYAVELLNQIDRSEQEYAEAQRILRLLKYIVDLDDEEYILNNSIIREFIGGSIILD